MSTPMTRKVAHPPPEVSDAGKTPASVSGEWLPALGRGAFRYLFLAEDSVAFRGGPAIRGGCYWLVRGLA